MVFVLTTLRVLLGLALLLIGVGSAFDQSARKGATEGALADLQDALIDGLPTIPAESVTDEYDGRHVLVQGELGPGTVADPLTGFALEGVWLKRRVELRQWEEQSRCTTRSGNSGRDCDYWYEQVWSADLIDSDSFAQPLFGEKKHVNPKEKPVDEPTFVEQTLNIGAWVVDTADFFRAFENRSVTAELLAVAALAGDWWADDVYAYNRTLPDVRLRYDYTWAPTGPVTLIAIPDNGQLRLNEDLARVPLLAIGTADARTIVEAAGGQVRDVQSQWIFYTVAGLMLLIRPVARRFSGLNDFTYAPAGKRIAMTAGVAVLIIAVIALLLPK
jgi:hypothetical protein